MRRSVLLPVVAFALVVGLLAQPVGAGTTQFHGFVGEDGSGDATGWEVPSGSIAPVEGDTPDGDGWFGRVTFEGCDGPRLNLGRETPARMSFFLHPEGDTEHPWGLGFFVQGSHDGIDYSEIVRVSYHDGWLWWNNSTDEQDPQPLAEVWDEWMLVELLFDWENDQLDILLWGEPFAVGIPFGEDADDVGLLRAHGCDGQGEAIGIDGISLTSSHQLSGTVSHAGDPLAGVEVFASTDLGPRYTCTNYAGHYVFDGVGVVTMIATGPSISDAGCTNPMFVTNPEARRPKNLEPLMVTFAEDPGGELFADTEVDLEVDAVPHAPHQLFRPLQEALWAAYHDDPVTLWNSLDGFAEGIDELLADDPSDDASKGKGKGHDKWNLTPEAAAAFHGYASDLTMIGLAVAPLDEIVVKVDGGMPVGPLENEFMQFAMETGIAVHVDGSGGALDFGPEDPPDVVLLEMAAFAFERPRLAEVLQDLWYLGDLTGAYGEWLLDFASVDDRLLGVPVAVSPKSLVWHRTPFAHEVPATLGQFQGLASDAVGDVAPLCNYIGSGEATGWLSTDWVEDLVLGKYGPSVYDAWIDHEVPFNGPEITWAVETYAAMMDEPGWVHDRENMSGTSFWENGPALLAGDCLLHRQAGFFANVVPPEEWDGLGTFRFPSSSPDFADALMGSGRFAGAISGSPSVQAFMAHLASADFGTEIAATEWLVDWSMPHADFDPLLYADPFRAEWASLTRAALAADLFRLDASDLMPGEVNETFWDMMRALADGEVTATEAVDAIEASWPATAGIRVNAGHDHVDGWGWGGDPSVTITVTRDAVDHVESATVVGEWFETGLGFDIVPGDVVTVTGDATGTTKALDVVSLTFDVFDAELNVLEGTAESGTLVRLNGGNEFDGFEAFATADESGVWSIDLLAEVGFDLTEGMGGEAAVDDLDGDATFAWPPEPPPEPTIRANPTGDYIDGWMFPAGTDVSVEVLSGVEVVWSTTAPVGVPEWDPGSTHFSVSTEESFDLLAGHTVRVTSADGSVVRLLDVVSLTFDVFDAELNVLEGTAPDGATVHVNGGTETSSFDVQSVADGGTWIVDLAPFDLTLDMGAEASMSEEDGDATIAWPSNR